MYIIVAVDQEWGIGYNNQLLFWIPKDMKRFKTLTEGCVVVMGRKTFASLPQQAPLTNRQNIILSKENIPSQDNLIVCHSLEELLNYIKDLTKPIFVIGGAQVYRQLLDYAQLALVTKVDKTVVKDTYFPNLDTLPNWDLIETSPPYHYKELTYRFTKYHNKNVKLF